MTAVEVRDSPRIRTKSLSRPSVVRRSTIWTPVRPPASPVADHRDAEPLQRPGHVDALAAGAREARGGPVAVPELEVRHEQRPVDRSVERDGDDHVKSPTKPLKRLPAWSSARPAYQPSRRPKPGLLDRSRRRPAAAVAMIFPRSSTCTSPSFWPCLDRQIDHRRSDDPLDEGTVDADERIRRLRGDEREPIGRRTGRAPRRRPRRR